MIYRRKWLLCHRGADPATIAEIVRTLEVNNQGVLLREGSDMSLDEFAELIGDEIGGGHRHFIILLNRHLTGPMFRTVFCIIRQQARHTSAFYKMRVEDCDVTGVEDHVDLAYIRNHDLRQREIRAICPNELARCC